MSKLGPPFGVAASSEGLGSDGHLVVRDRPGAMSQKVMRHYFEDAVKQTEVLAKRVHIGLVTVEADGAVVYADPVTQAMWVSWALGMRCAERLQAAVNAQTRGVGFGVDRAA